MMMQNNKPVFITGIGTDVGKTVAAAIVTEALEANYWKPVQAGFDDGTDALSIQHLISNLNTVIHPEVYKLKLPASPHIAAREEGIRIDLDIIYQQYSHLIINNIQLTIIEGAGGLLVPLNEDEFVLELIKKLDARVIIVSRNYLGSINHSLLTASVCRSNDIDVVGWVFNDQYMHYEEEIVRWSGYPKIASLPHAKEVNKAFVKEQAERIKESLQEHL